MKQERLELHKPRLQTQIIDPALLKDGALVLLCVIALSAQSAVRLRGIHGVNVAALFILYVAVARSFVRGVLLALIIGYIADLFSGETRGLVVSALVLTYAFVQLIFVRFVRPQWFVVASLATVACLMDLAFRAMFVSSLGPGYADWGLLTSGISGTLFGAVALGYPLYVFLGWVDSRLQGRRPVAELRG